MSGDEVEVLRAEFLAFKTLLEECDRRYEGRFTATDEKTSLALTSSKEAVTKAEIATEKRFDSVNEFRGSLKDQASLLLPRSEADAKFRSVDEKFKSIEEKIEDAKKHTQAFGQWTFQQMLTVGGLLAGLIYFMFRHP